MADQKKPLLYKGRPLRRKDNLIYYGSMADPYIILLQVLETETVKGMPVATRVGIQLQRTDGTAKSRDSIAKRSEKDSLYAAIDVASIWLDRALAERTAQ